MAGMSGQVAAGCSDARAASTVQQGDRQIAEGCHNLGARPCAGGSSLPQRSHHARSGGCFRFAITADQREQTRNIGFGGREAGAQIDDLDPRFGRCLDQTGEAALCWPCGASVASSHLFGASRHAPSLLAGADEARGPHSGGSY